MLRRSDKSMPTKKPSVKSSYFGSVFAEPTGIVEAEMRQSSETPVSVLERPQSDIGFDEMFAAYEAERGCTDADEAVVSLSEELFRFAESLRQEFRSSVAELHASQAAAAAAQSDVLRTLAEAVFQSSASRDVSPETMERAFCGVEQRLLTRIEAIFGEVKVADHTATSLNKAVVSPCSGTQSARAVQTPVTGLIRSWAEIRSEMMCGDELSEASVSPVSPEPEKSILPKVTQLSCDRHFQLPEQDPSLEVPATVDISTLSELQLQDAFREREEFITTLIARIRRQQETATQQLSAEQLRQLVDDVPEELAAQVRHTLKQMDDLARMGELELSLERARIARQVNQLEHSRQTIEHNARQLGLQLNADGTIAPQSGQNGRGTSSRRWLGKLGFGQ